MAPRRRAVERATFRRRVLDRVLAVVLVVVGASGLMSVLPGQSQRAVSRLACRAASIGLGACGAAGLDLEDTQLAPPRCLTLSTLDQVLPEVRVRQLYATQGLPVTISTARSGDVAVQLGDSAQPVPPDLLAGAARPERPVAHGVTVPSQAEWYLPRGQGLEDLVVAAQDGHHRWVEQRSSLALLARVLQRDDRDVPPPSVTYSRISLEQSPWPRYPDVPLPPRSGRVVTPPQVPTATSSSVTLDLGAQTLASYNAISGESAVITPLRGTVGGEPVTGTLRWTRDVQGTVTSVLVAIVGSGRLSPGEPRTSLPGPAVAYISIPVRTPPEQLLVQSWLAPQGHLVVPLDELLGLRAPVATDQLGSFLSRAATVTILRYALVSPAQLQQRVTDELVTLRRVDWDGVRLVEAAGVAPTSTGTGRRVVSDPACRT